MLVQVAPVPKAPALSRTQLNRGKQAVSSIWNVLCCPNQQQVLVQASRSSRPLRYDQMVTANTVLSVVDTCGLLSTLSAYRYRLPQSSRPLQCDQKHSRCYFLYKLLGG
jgi:hypothetical protein